MLIAYLMSVAIAGDLESDATGRFVSNQDRSMVEAELAAIVERSAQSVSAALRLIAKPALEDQATACPIYETKLDGDLFSVVCVGKEPFTWRVGTTGVAERGGEPFTVSLEQEGRTLTLDFRGENGGKRYAYTFTETGALHVLQEVYSPHLPLPMRWALTFQRAE
jgi:hypothetical protein